MSQKFNDFYTLRFESAGTFQYAFVFSIDFANSKVLYNRQDKYLYFNFQSHIYGY